MPKRVFRKRNRGRKYAGSRPAARITRRIPGRVNLYQVKPIGGLPARQLVKLCYCETIKMSGAVDGYAVYNLNSLFDIQNTLGLGFAGTLNSNTQPLYRDQWAALYDQYRVLGAKYILRCYVGDDSGTVISNMRIVAWPSDTQTTGSGSIMVDSQRPRAKMTMCSSGASQNRSIKNYVPTWWTLSTNKGQVRNDDACAATMGTSPTRLAFLNIRATDMDASGASTNVSLYIDVRIVLYTQLFNRIDVAGS